MLSGREAIYEVISFKPLGMESWVRITSAFSWSQEEYGAGYLYIKQLSN